LADDLAAEGFEALRDEMAERWGWSGSATKSNSSARSASAALNPDWLSMCLVHRHLTERSDFRRFSRVRPLCRGDLAVTPFAVEHSPKTAIFRSTGWRKRQRAVRSLETDCGRQLLLP
jgi:hypothetical protein